MSDSIDVEPKDAILNEDTLEMHRRSQAENLMLKVP